MDHEEALAVLRAIDREACERSLNAFQPSDRPDLIRGVYEANVERLARNEALLASLVPPVIPRVVTPPDGYRLEWVDVFTDVDGLPWDGGRWRAYGPGNSERWGQGQGPNGGRVGWYHPDALSVTDDGLRITTQPDPEGRSVNGLPGWRCGYLRNRSLAPKWHHAVVRYRHDRAPGYWPAPLWFTHAPYGSSRAEVDTQEWFSDRPDVVRQAVHLGRNSGGTTYNIANHMPGISQEAPFVEGWQVAESIVEPEGDGARITLRHNGELTYSVSTQEIAAALGYHDAWLDLLNGWNIYICTQMGGAGGAVPPSATGPYHMDIDYVAISVPE